MTIHIDGPKAIQLLEECVAERGADYVYEYSECNYVVFDKYGDRRVGCMIGLALHKAGLTVDQLTRLGGSAREISDDLADLGVHLDGGARAAFSWAQNRQDVRCTWGEALAEAKAEVASHV